jgi:hypothetical protein
MAHDMIRCRHASVRQARLLLLDDHDVPFLSDKGDAGRGQGHADCLDQRSAQPDHAKAVLGQLVNWTFVARNLEGGGIARADQD